MSDEKVFMLMKLNNNNFKVKIAKFTIKMHHNDIFREIVQLILQMYASL